MTIDLWCEVADRMGVGFELREYGSIQALKTNAIVFQCPIVKYLAKNEFLGRVEVLPIIGILKELFGGKRPSYSTTRMDYAFEREYAEPFWPSGKAYQRSSGGAID